MSPRTSTTRVVHSRVDVGATQGLCRARPTDEFVGEWRLQCGRYGLPGVGPQPRFGRRNGLLRLQEEEHRCDRGALVVRHRPRDHKPKPFYSDSGLASGSTYYYWVVAHDCTDGLRLHRRVAWATCLSRLNASGSRNEPAAYPYPQESSSSRQGMSGEATIRSAK